MNLQKFLKQRVAMRKIIELYIEKLEDAKEHGREINFDTTMRLLETKVSALNTLNEKICNQTEMDFLEDEIFETETYILNLEVQIDIFKSFRESNRPGLGNRSTNAQQNDQSSTNQLLSNPALSVTASSSQFICLPTLNLPTFNGDILNWQTFSDSFETSVQKFSYLKSLLESDAAITVEGFALTSANYTRAVELLRERYGQQHKITHSMMQALLQLFVPSDSVHSMRHFYDRMETYIRGLESMVQHQGTYGSLLVPVILDKLPADVRRNLARSHGNNDWNICDLRRAINNEINIMEAGDITRKPETEMYGSAASFYTSANGKRASPKKRQRVQQRTSPRCAFCHESHLATDCRKYSDYAARTKIVKRDRLCYNCLGKHTVSTCKSIRRCYKCHRKHHTSICHEEASSQKTSDTQPGVSNLNPDAAVFHSTTHSNAGVLLKTAITDVCSMDITRTTAILLDEGVHKSFITKKLADELQLPVEGADSSKVSTFGDENNKVCQYERTTVTVYLKTDSGADIPEHVLIVQKIAASMNNRLSSTAAKLPYLRSLKLAHPVSHDRSFLIDILIGADHYWDIVLDDVICGNGPTAVRSKIGYLLSGPLPTSGSVSQDSHIMNIVVLCGADESLERFWNLKSIGISATEPDRKSREYLTDYQQSCIEYIDGRYYAMLPWKQEHPPLFTYFDIRLNRTLSTVRRLRNEPEVLKKYNEIIADREKRGFIEKATDDQDTPHAIHYIPHHPIKRNRLLPRSE